MVDNNTFRLVQLTPGSWQPADPAAEAEYAGGGTSSSSFPPRPAVSKGRRLLNKKLHVWLAGQAANPTFTTVLVSELSLFD